MLGISEFWFNNEQLWFNASQDDDTQITNLFGQLFSTQNSILSLPSLPSNIFEHILLYDQITRHIFRGQPTTIEKYHKLALELSMYILDNNMDQQFSDKEQCFILMPLRHTFSKNYLEMVIDKMNIYMKNTNSKYYERFFKSTVYSLSKITTKELKPEQINSNILDNDIESILEFTQDITNNYPFIIKNNTFYKSFKDTLIKIKFDQIIISISGGVDSMVSSYILSYLAKKMNFKVIGIMINYNNRSECLLEVEFVKRWCAKFNIELYIRHITELHRETYNNRNNYEQITRKIRFDMYKKFNCPVVLGHNLDDCVENILTNIRKGRLDNLRGMSEFVDENDCLLVRPMLNINKIDIITFAKDHNIPYLQDSTPKWSDRGKMRDVLIPFLNEFDSSFISGLINLADTTTNINKSLDEVVVKLFYDNKIAKINGQFIHVEFSYTKENRLGYIFWKKIIKKLCQDYNIQICSNKSIMTLVQKLELNKSQRIKLYSNIEININCTTKKILFIFN